MNISVVLSCSMSSSPVHVDWSAEGLEVAVVVDADVGVVAEDVVEDVAGQVLDVNRRHHIDMVEQKKRSRIITVAVSISMKNQLLSPVAVVVVVVVVVVEDAEALVTSKAMHMNRREEEEQVATVAKFLTISLMSSLSLRSKYFSSMLAMTGSDRMMIG